MHSIHCQKVCTHIRKFELAFARSHPEKLNRPLGNAAAANTGLAITL